MKEGKNKSFKHMIRMKVMKTFKRIEQTLKSFIRSKMGYLCMIKKEGIDEISK